MTNPLTFINISSDFRLYAFATYQNMVAAKESIPKVVQAKALNQLQEIEARHYVECIGQPARFRNFHEANRNLNTKESVRDALITALQILYQTYQYHAKYIIISRRY